MCDGVEKIKAIIESRNTPLRCESSLKCWCTQVTTKFSHALDLEDCMSPQEMLNQTSVVLPEHDVKYLKKLANRTFVRYGEDK